MGAILFIAIIFYFIAKLVTDWSYLSEHNRWMKEYNKDFRAAQISRNIKLAKKGDYAISRNGDLLTTKYSDGSSRYDKNFKPIEKGRLFE